MSRNRLGPKQKKILEILTAYPESTITEIAEAIHGKPVMPRSKQYNSTCRSLHQLEERGLVERKSGLVYQWHIKKNK